MGEYEDLLEQVRDAGLDDVAEGLEKFKGSSLRQKAAQVPELERERDELKGRIAKMERTPKVQAAFRKAGVDLENLSKAEAKVLAGFDFEGDEPSAEAVSQFVEEYGLPTIEAEESEDEEPAAGAISRQARSSSQRVSGATTITPEDAVEWDPEKRMRFLKAHPDEAEALMRGETVTGVPAP